MKKTFLMFACVSCLSGCSFMALLALPMVKEDPPNLCSYLIRLDNGQKVPEKEACQVIYANDQCDYYNTYHKGEFYSCLTSKGYKFHYEHKVK